MSWLNILESARIPEAITPHWHLSIHRHRYRYNSSVPLVRSKEPNLHLQEDFCHLHLQQLIV